MPNIQRTLAENIRWHRKAAKISQVDFARALSVSQPTVHHWEKGHRCPSPQTLRAISTLLKTDLSQYTQSSGESGGEMSQGNYLAADDKLPIAQKNSQDEQKIEQSAPSPMHEFPIALSEIRRVAFQGVEGAYSHQAIAQCFPEADPVACDNFDKALSAVREGHADLAMIPIENALYGRVSDIHHLLPHSSLYIIGEYFLPIQHMLLGTQTAELGNITQVISHPQALGQSRGSLKALGVQTQNWFDTAGAAAEIAKRQDPTWAAVASELAAEHFGLKILRRNVEDRLGNVTRFVVMSPRRIDPPFRPDQPIKTITSLMFTVRSLPAALYKCMGGFATQGVNVIKLESYVPHFSSNNASFYAEIEGNPRENNLCQALDELGYFTTQSRILGVYAAAPYRDQT